MSLVSLATTGFLLATKDVFPWLRPPEAQATQVDGLHRVISVDRAAKAALALGIPELQRKEDIDRIDYRPKSNIFKIVSERGYHEVHVDAATGRVVQRAFRLDQFTEDVHDLSIVGTAVKHYWLSTVAVLLFTLGVSGVCIFAVPLVRRTRFRRQRSAGDGPRRTL